MLPTVIDLSHFSGDVDFVKVRNAGIESVILKATQGIAFIDEKFIPNAHAARQVGLLVGAYHFGTAVDPNAQANFFLSTIEPIREYTPILPVLDLERNPVSQMTPAFAQVWMRAVQDKLGVVPTLYAGEYLKSFGPQSYLLGCPLWLSEYGPVAKLPIGFDTWTLWQFTDGNIGPEPHTIDGVTGKLDINYFNGTTDELTQFWATHSK